MFRGLFIYLLGKITKGPIAKVAQVMTSDTKQKHALVFGWDIYSFHNMKLDCFWHTFIGRKSRIWLIVPGGRTCVTGTVTAAAHVIVTIHICPSEEQRIQNSIKPRMETKLLLARPFRKEDIHHLECL